MLGEDRAHEQAAIAAALDSELVSVGIFVIDQVARAGSKIVEDILLFRQIASLVPGLAVFAAAAQVGNHKHEAMVQQCLALEREIGRDADVKSTVAGQ